MSGQASILQLDVGNSSAKWRLVEGAKVLARGRYRAEDADSEAALLGCAEAVDAIWISSVAGESKESVLSAMLSGRWGVTPWFARSEAETLGLRNSYAEPGRMGVDRWLAMLAARALNPRERLCVVDAGSALTIDLISVEGAHEGGYIIPGPALMERALLLDTDRVRFAEPAEYSLSPGISTAEAVRHGIALAEAGAVALALQQGQGVGSMTPVFSGGGGKWLWEALGCRGTWQPELVLDGLQLVGEATQSTQ